MQFGQQVLEKEPINIKCDRHYSIKYFKHFANLQFK